MATTIGLDPAPGGLYQRLGNLGLIELAAAHETAESKRRFVELIVAVVTVRPLATERDLITMSLAPNTRRKNRGC